MTAKICADKPKFEDANDETVLLSTVVRLQHKRHATHIETAVTHTQTH